MSFSESNFNPVRGAESMAEEEIINGIILEKIDEEDKEWQISILQYGNKCLKVAFSFDNEEAETKIENIEGERKINQTTLLYKAAKKMIQDRSNQFDEKIRYTFLTSNKKMADWAKSKGKEIFNWDDEGEYEDDSNDNEYIFVKSFEPEK